jgi:hypothetical protein
LKQSSLFNLLQPTQHLENEIQKIKKQWKSYRTCMEISS